MFETLVAAFGKGSFGKEPGYHFTYPRASIQFVVE
jgi:hypothetical protein